jgi:hypothetical protein
VIMMAKSKRIRLLVLASGTMLALSGCTGQWLPWLIGAGLVTTLLGQQPA